MSLVPVNKIIPFSSVDGPGNRSVVFLQGCGFNCQYCHNPETRNMCINCGICVSKCPTGALSMEEGEVIYDYSKCCFCDNCIKACPNGASPRIRWMSPQDVADEVGKNVPYIRGITVSGGECTTYPEFLRAFLEKSKQMNLTTLLDSNGSYDFSKDEELLNVTDGVMLDIKALAKDEHITVTGVSNESVLNNMEYLALNHKLYEVRTVVVPGLFDYENTIANISRMLSKYDDKVRYKIIGYRENGVREKYRLYETPSRNLLNELGDIALSNGAKDICII
ncbi:MAG: YjjW family glycine radical enzyme activase [Butyrivibrio sp.]|nr:YjjW family glycine radical enzyme activase [Butyrivibrio sp.]